MNLNGSNVHHEVTMGDSSKFFNEEELRSNVHQWLSLCPLAIEKSRTCLGTYVELELIYLFIYVCDLCYLFVWTWTMMFF